MMKSCAFAARAAASICSRVALGRPVGDVAGDRVVEENRILRHDADLAAQRGERDTPDVDAVDENCARC